MSFPSLEVLVSFRKVLTSSLTLLRSHIQFGLFSPAEITKLAEFQAVNRELYKIPAQEPVRFGCLDRRLGTSDKSAACETCGSKLADCPGHFAYIKLELPVFHIGYFKQLLTLLNMICKSCSRILMDNNEREACLRMQNAAGTDFLQKKTYFKRLADKCKKVSACPHCGELNGLVKKAGSALKIVHERTRTKKLQEKHNEFVDTLSDATEHNKDLKNYMGKLGEDINPVRALYLLRNIPSSDCELLDMDTVLAHPENLIITHILVPPVCLRPSVCMDPTQGTNEDDITMKLAEIIHVNSMLKKTMEKGGLMSLVMEDWDFLQLQCAMYINSDVPGLPTIFGRNAKPIRGFCQRLKGKQGRFRGNLSGKRVDFSSRTVISPDPNLRVGEVGVPRHIAQTLTYPESVARYNIERLRAAVRNGPEKYPGANFVAFRSGEKKFLRYGNRDAIAEHLQFGDVVERHLVDGDTVLFNRQPSLHKVSIMAHKARVMDWRTFRFNECTCSPFNADFDGDEMNLHLPQTEEARAEADVLMSVCENLVTPRNGEPLVAAIQDFITGAFLLSHKETFFNRSEFCAAAAYLTDGQSEIVVPPPAILKPWALWTGKQVVSVWLNSIDGMKGRVFLSCKGRTYSNRDESRCEKDGWVLIRGSEHLAGVLDKTVLGSGSKTSIFYVLLKDHRSTASADAMGRLARFVSRWLCERGFSIGLNDVMPSATLSVRKKSLVASGYADCDGFLRDYSENRLQSQPGCSREQTLENLMTHRLSDVRDLAGNMCTEELHWANAALVMATCGSKGSKINISQMIATLGQQTVSGKRMPEGFLHRTLPHFPLNDKSPEGRGFVANSFFTGLNATEFFFHTMGGREGLVDTAVKTAETGYMQRRLVKALEDLACSYDGTVRNCSGSVVQFTYGDDGLDPAMMEALTLPLDVSRTWRYALDCYQLEAPPHVLTASTSAASAAASSSDTSLNEATLQDAVANGIAVAETKFHVTIPAKLKAKIVAVAMDGIREMDRPNALRRVQEGAVLKFCEICVDRYCRSKVESGTAVGALCAQSIGEPGTQMTLQTFHFAGVASMNITLGVPRIKEIINAAKSISTPVITAKLQNSVEEYSARLVQGRIACTTLGQVAEYIKEVYRKDRCFVEVKLHQETIENLQLDVTPKSVAQQITKNIKNTQVDFLGSDMLHVCYKVPKAAKVTDTSSDYFELQSIVHALPDLLVQGIPGIGRAVISKEQERFKLLVEGYDLRAVMNTPGVNGAKTRSNHISDVERVLGIEAARSTIINEIREVMESHHLSVDERHIMLLGDLMSSRGEILGITRFGIAKMKDSVLMLASFEKTTDHLFEAAAHARKDPIQGVSECIIMGLPMQIGTGSFKLLHDVQRGVLPSSGHQLLLYAD